MGYAFSGLLGLILPLPHHQTLDLRWRSAPVPNQSRVQSTRRCKKLQNEVWSHICLLICFDFGIKVWLPHTRKSKMILQIFSASGFRSLACRPFKGNQQPKRCTDPTWQGCRHPSGGAWPSRRPTCQVSRLRGWSGLWFFTFLDDGFS